MNSDACCFAITQISNEFGCENGELVTRRAGPDIACQSDMCREKCLIVHEHLKRVGLDAFEYEDDLTQVPHGVWVKIQFGGLLGLQAETSDNSSNTIENISHLISSAEQQFSHLDQLPYEKVVSSMQKFKTRRRKK